MQSNDIILQVSEETAHIMEDITAQLFDDTSAELDKIEEMINDSVEKIEELLSRFSKRSEESHEKLSNGQNQIFIQAEKIDGVSARLEKVNCSIEQFIKNTEHHFSEVIGQTSSLNDGLSDTQTELSNKLEDIASSILQLTAKQDEISSKQSDIEKELQYLKLPFYKRWFKKG